MNPRITRLAVAGAVAGFLFLTAILYWPGLSGPFVFDDVQNIVRVHVKEPSLAAIVYSITHNESGMLGRGVSVLSFVLTGLQYGLEPWGYKFHNLLIHLLCGLLLFRLLTVTLVHVAREEQREQARLVAILASGAWLLHPLLVSTVLYAVQRMTQLASLFLLLALLAYWQMRASEKRDWRYWLYGWLLFPLFLLLAMFSKEIGVLIPLYVLVFEVVVFRINVATLKRQPHTAIWLAVFVVLPVLLGSTYVVTHFDRIADYSMRTFSIGERLLTQIHAIFFYVRLILVPRVRAMSLMHDDFAVTQAMDAQTMLLLAVLLLAVVGIWWLRSRAPVLAFGVAWFLVSHLLESTFIPLELVFEHRNYLATAGLVLPPIWYLMTLPAVKPARLLVAGYLVVFVLQTFSRVQEWSSEGVMMSVAVADHPRSPRANVLFANYLYTQNRLDEAFAHLQTAQDLAPSDAGPGMQLLMYGCAHGISDAQLLARVESQLQTYPLTTHALNGMDALLGLYSRDRCTHMTLDDLQRLIVAAGSSASTQENSFHRGYVQRFAGLLAFLKKDYAKGVAAMTAGYEDTGLVNILAELTRYQITLRRLDDAGRTLARIEEINRQQAGVEDYTVALLTEALAAARRDSAAASATVPVEQGNITEPAVAPL